MTRNISTDYTGRRVDILVLDVNTAGLSTSPSRVPLSYGEEPRVTAGVQKAVQAFVITLFTIQGTGWNKSLGCIFLEAIQQYRVRTSVDANNYFMQSVPVILAQINQGVTAPDEIITAATLLSAVVDQDQMTLTIQFLTLSGVAVTYLVPVPAVPPT